MGMNISYTLIVDQQNHGLKQHTEMPYILATTGSTEAISWLGSAIDDTGQAGISF